MPRPSTGGVRLDRRRREPTWEARFTAYGKRRFVRLGTPAEGWDRKRADAELRHIMADVERGLWRPPAKEVAEAPRDVPTFHRFASEWFERQRVEGGRRGQGLTEAGRADLEWRLSNHLLPHFAGKLIDTITVEDVDVFRTGKAREGRLNPTSINKLLGTLAAILEDAVEYGLIPRNPAKGRRRRLASIDPARSWIDRADHLAALLDAAGQLDKAARVRHGQRRALLATLAFAGLRLGEALALCWRDVDLARGVLTVRGGKTAAAARTVNLLPVLQDELSAYRARQVAPAETLVFATSTGHKHGESNVRRRIMEPAVRLANEQLATQRIDPLPDGLTPQSLRRTFASILFAMGENPPYVQAQLGHTDPTITLRFYARVMDRRDGEPDRLKALVNGAELVATGSSPLITASRVPAHHPENPVTYGHKRP
jgi:integrase